ncbi:hypothetical protein BD410DRAFT_808233 [Rickenella mellea]|uniref:Uncharacterized protein n=1 Tax=Rickenella mellea TaxID=50990 RepID=A0A4Y7PMP9_9AGAM|nr:hypothetical protein BD410DRAFT_808233 [Rickenella mellea]
MEETKGVVDSPADQSFTYVTTRIRLLQESNESRFRSITESLADIIGEMPRKSDIEELQRAVRQLSERVFEEQVQIAGSQPFPNSETLDEEFARATNASPEPFEPDDTISSWDSQSLSSFSMNGPADVCVPLEAERDIPGRNDATSGMVRTADGWWGPAETANTTRMRRARDLVARSFELVRRDIFLRFGISRKPTFRPYVDLLFRVRWHQLTVVAMLLYSAFILLVHHNPSRTQVDHVLPWDDYEL